MLECLKRPEPDKILALISQYREDPRSEKIDLGVGVYKDSSGTTPVMRSVRTAEKRLAELQDTKSYLGMMGDAGFVAALKQIVFGETQSNCLKGIQTPGGSGALRLLAEMIAISNPDATIWVSNPTWANHIATMQAAGLKVCDYPYLNSWTSQLDFDAMLEAVSSAPAGDVILLHACCHNPTGANLTMEDWVTLGDAMVENGLFPFVDIAYQGFGDGLNEDAKGLRHLMGVVPEMAVAVSCSKNFAVYRDRVGAAFVLGGDEEQANIAVQTLTSIARKSYSMPPDHGAAAVRIVLEDERLRADWELELNEMRERMLILRSKFADALQRSVNSERFDFLRNQRGMFSKLGLTKQEVNRLRNEHAIYMVGDSRINIAGLPEDGMEALANAIARVITSTGK